MLNVSDIYRLFISLLQVLVPRAFTMFAEPDGPRQNPDTVDDLFRLAVRFCYRMPNAFFQQDVAGHLIEAAKSMRDIEHTDARRSIEQFLNEVKKHKNIAT
jgi:transportin-3